MLHVNGAQLNRVQQNHLHVSTSFCHYFVFYVFQIKSCTIKCIWKFLLFSRTSKISAKQRLWIQRIGDYSATHPSRWSPGTNVRSQLPLTASQVSTDTPILVTKSMIERHLTLFSIRLLTRMRYKKCISSMLYL